MCCNNAESSALLPILRECKGYEGSLVSVIPRYYLAQFHVLVRKDRRKVTE